MRNKNIGLYLSNASNKKFLLEKIMGNQYLRDDVDLSSLKGVLYSLITINRLIDDEMNHDYFLIKTKENSNLYTMSSGQQKKALLAYLIAQKPEYMVLDDVYSNIDKETQQSITSTLVKLEETTLMIQLFFRKRDLLPCIHTVYSIRHYISCN